MYKFKSIKIMSADYTTISVKKEVSEKIEDLAGELRLSKSKVLEFLLKKYSKENTTSRKVFAESSKILSELNISEDERLENIDWDEEIVKYYDKEYDQYEKKREEELKKE